MDHIDNPSKLKSYLSRDDFRLYKGKLDDRTTMIFYYELLRYVTMNNLQYKFVNYFDGWYINIVNLIEFAKFNSFDAIINNENYDESLCTLGAMICDSHYNYDYDVDIEGEYEYPIINIHTYLQIKRHFYEETTSRGKRQRE